jgi:cobalt-zinc-cadmium efflux system membrane fusion protein
MKISRTMLIIGALIAVGAGVYAFAPSKSAAPATKEAAAGKRKDTALKVSK